MPTIQESFPSHTGDPFNNLTAERKDGFVEFQMHDYEESTTIKLSNEVVARLVLFLMEPKEPIIGYLPGGKRIGPCQPNRIYTAAIVSCCGCHRVIRGAGGPLRGALCLDCWEAASL